MNIEQCLAELKSNNHDSDSVFNTIKSVAYLVQGELGSESSAAMDLAVRLKARADDFEDIAPGAGNMISAVMREVGLFPYIISTETANWRDLFLQEAMRPERLQDYVLHKGQARVFKRLVEGESLVLSAPTSFGKSLLIDALIATREPNSIVAVVPTIALLDEFRRRMEKRFPQYQVITQTIEVISREKFIIIGTQERILERTDIQFVDLFVIDEFYKLDLRRDDNRSRALNGALARFGKQAKQIYMLGPSIDKINDASQYRPGLSFVKTQFSPVAADIIDRRDFAGSYEKLFDDLSGCSSTSLIYVRSPDASYKAARELIDLGYSQGKKILTDLSNWIRDNYHEEWVLAEAVEHGIGIHHGRIPRSLAHVFITLFNAKILPVLLCTSSMIEGVNTSAENIFIFNKNISRNKLDRFTFENIKGRAGRMFQHYIGKIYIFYDPPDIEAVDVSVPLFDGEAEWEQELLYLVDPQDLGDQGKARRAEFEKAAILPAEVIQRWTSFGVEALNQFAAELRDDATLMDKLIWSEFPKYQELAQTLEVAWNRFQFSKHGMRSARQMTLYAFRFQQRDSISDYISGLVENDGAEGQKEIDSCLNFMKAAEFTVPEVLRMMNDVVNEVAGDVIVDYRSYAQALQNWFLPEHLRILDEFGVPVPIIERSRASLELNDFDTLRELLSKGELALNFEDDFERRLVQIGTG